MTNPSYSITLEYTLISAEAYMQGQTAENFQESIKNVISLLEGLKFQFQLIEDEELEWLILGTLQTEIGALRLSIYMQKKASHFVLYLYRNFFWFAWRF